MAFLNIPFDSECPGLSRQEFLSGKNENVKQLMKDIVKYTETLRPNRNDKRNMKVKSFIGFTYRVSA